MKTPTKFVKPLTTAQREQLSALMKSAAPQRTRMRAHAVLLSERRYSLEQIADIYQVDRDRVSQWLEWWEAEQVAGLDDEPAEWTAPQADRGRAPRSAQHCLAGTAHDQDGVEANCGRDRQTH